MSAIDRALAHRASLPLRRVEVDEWGDESGPLVIHWTPWTAYEKREIFAKSQGSDFRLACWVVARKALDAEGNRIFTDAHAHKLERGAHDQVVARVSQKITADRDEDLVDGDDGYGDTPDITNASAMGTKKAVEQAEKN